MVKKTSIEKSKLLIVEGMDEVHFFSKLLEEMSLDGEIQIENLRGKDNQAHFKALLTTTPGHERIISLGIVRDADNDPVAAFQSICDHLQSINFPVPERPAMFTEGTPKTGIMILPGEQKPGMLENLCLESVSNDPAMECIEQYFSCLESKLQEMPNNEPKAVLRTFLTSRELLEQSLFDWIRESLDKAQPSMPIDTDNLKVHAFLASRYKPTLDLGIASKKGYWPLNHEAFSPIKGFLLGL